MSVFELEAGNLFDNAAEDMIKRMISDGSLPTRHGTSTLLTYNGRTNM